MELWRVRKEYRMLASKLRRGQPQPQSAEAEQRLVVALAACDRLETEASVLRNARKYTAARLGRLVKWVQAAALLGSAPLTTVRKADEQAAETLSRALARGGFSGLAQALRQGLDELAHLEQRVTQTRARLSRHATQAALEFHGLVGALRRSFPSVGH